MRKICGGVSDLIIFGYQTIDGQKTEKYTTNTTVLKNQTEIVSAIIKNMNNGVWMHSPCNKLYKTDIMKKLKFKEEYIVSEDMVFNLEYFNECRNMTLLDKIGYNYTVLYKRVKYKKGIIQSHIKATKKLLEYFKDKLDKEKYIDIIGEFFYSSMFYDLIAITISKKIKMSEKLNEYRLLKKDNLYKEIKIPKTISNKKLLFFKILNLNSLLAYLFIKIYCFNWRN